MTKNEVGAMRLTMNVDGLVLEGSIDGTFPIDQSKTMALDQQQVLPPKRTEAPEITATATITKPETAKDNASNG